jgi:F-type H+-transporting ATPase subunit delta
MRLEGVARRYALALVDAVPEAERSTVDARLAEAAELIRTDPLRAVWTHPGIPAGQKVGVIRALGLHPWVERFLVLLITHRRERLLEPAAVAFHQELLDRSGTILAEVRTARPVDPDWQQRIVSALAARLQHEVEATFQVDPALLGGIEVRYQDELVDATVRGRLKRLQRALKDEVNIREA